MGSIEPTPERATALVACEYEGAVAMINLLRFRERARYADGIDAAPCSGREAYQRYGVGVAPLLAEAGAQVVWAASVAVSVIAPDGEEWDEAIVVQYPSRQHFLDMVERPEYQQVARHREAALADSRLIATRPAESSLLE